MSQLTIPSNYAALLRFRWWVALFCLGLAGALPGSTGVRPLESHEIFVAETAKTMIQNENFLVPIFNSKLRLEKPPLSYWGAVASELVGDAEFPHISEFEARLPSALSAIALMFVVVGMGFIAFDDRRVGWVAGALFATTWGFHIFSHTARPEMLYTLFCGLEMLGFLWLHRSPEHSYANLFAGLLAWGGFAGAILAKGPLFPLFIVLGVSVSLLLRNPRPSFLQWLRSLRSLRPFMGLTFALASGIYFLYLASLAEGAVGFWALQMTQPTEVPLWLRPFRMYFPLAVVGLLLPWSLLLIPIIREIWRTRHPAALMLGMSSLSCLLFLSFSGKLRLHYVLPAIPFLCVLMAWAGVAFYNLHVREKVGRIHLVRLLGFHAWILGAAAGGLTLLAFQNVPHKILNPWIFVVPLMVGTVAIGGMSWYYREKKMIQAFGGLIIMSSLISAGMGFGILGYEADFYTERDFARKVGQIAPPDLPLFTDPEFAPYLLYYGDRTSELLDPRELQNFQTVHRAPVLLVYDRENLKRAGLQGRELYQQQMTKQGKQIVLFQTEGEDSNRLSAQAGNHNVHPSP
ncbi:MAG: phospholipid carrier-dependent glycosyltransferase [Nitrospirota bacterium]